MKHKAVQGFTLIELLIVIAVLGILAVAVLSAIDPIEQINRSRDTSSRSDAEQLLSAIDRYYASKGYYPWMEGASSDNTDTNGLVEITSLSQTFGDDAQPVLELLSSGGTEELKTSFVNRITGNNYNNLFIYNRGQTGDSTYVCFVPNSGSFKDSAANRCEGTEDSIPEDLGEDLVCGTAGNDESYSCLP